MNLYQKEAKLKAENKRIRNIFLIATLVYWVGFILISVDDNVQIGEGYLYYVLIVGTVTGFSAMIIKAPL